MDFRNSRSDNPDKNQSNLTATDSAEHSSPAGFSFDELYKQYVGQVYRQCLSMTRDTEKAKDFTHDIFIKVLVKQDSFQQRANVSTWLYAIAFNYCSDQLKRARRLPTESIEGDHVSSMTESDGYLLEEEVHRLAYRALASLPEKEQLLFRQKYEQGLSLEEMAQIHQLSISALKMRLKRSRAKLSLYWQSNPAD